MVTYDIVLDSCQLTVCWSEDGKVRERETVPIVFQGKPLVPLLWNAWMFRRGIPHRLATGLVSHLAVSMDVPGTQAAQEIHAVLRHGLRQRGKVKFPKKYELRFRISMGTTELTRFRIAASSLRLNGEEGGREALLSIATDGTDVLLAEAEPPLRE